MAFNGFARHSCLAALKSEYLRLDFSKIYSLAAVVLKLKVPLSLELRIKILHVNYHSKVDYLLFIEINDSMY